QLSSDFAAQTHQAFLNLQLALAHLDASLLDIAVLRILVVDHSTKKHQFLIQEMQTLWKNHPFPACTLIPVPCLALPAMQKKLKQQLIVYNPDAEHLCKLNSILAKIKHYCG